jgi:hypothetical protein
MFVAPYRLTPSLQPPDPDPSSHAEFTSIIKLDVPPTQNLHGYETECNRGKYSLNWDLWADFDTWRTQEQWSKSIEFGQKNLQITGPDVRWAKYVCSRQGANGEATHIPKSDQRNMGTKWTKCPCCLMVKTYQDTTKLLGTYYQIHSHSIGEKNVKFM